MPAKFILTLCSLLLLPFSSPAMAAAGNVTHLDGVLMLTRAGAEPKLLGVGSAVEEGDLLATQKNTFARVKFNDGGEVVLRPNTELKVSAYRYNPEQPAEGSSVMSLIKGGLRAATGLIAKRRKENYQVETPTATIGIRGTNFGALYCKVDEQGINVCDDIRDQSGNTPKEGLHVDVSQGAIVVTNDGGVLIVNSGRYGFVQTPGAAPVEVPASEGTAVSMPASISSNESSGGGQGFGDHNGLECSAQ